MSDRRGGIIDAVRRHHSRYAWFALLLPLVLCLAGPAACRNKELRPIVFANNTITVHNQTREEWLAVEVWLNYHYRVTAPALLPGERQIIPLDVFVAGFGQRFNIKRTGVQTIQVKAKTKSGAPVDLMFGTGPRR